MKSITLKTGKRYESCQSWYRNEDTYNCKLMDLNPEDKLITEIPKGLKYCAEKRYWLEEELGEKSMPKCEFLEYFLGELNNALLEKVLQKKDEYGERIYQKFKNQIKFLEHLDKSRIPRMILFSMIDNKAVMLDEQDGVREGIWSVDILTERKDKKFLRRISKLESKIQKVNCRDPCSGEHTETKIYNTGIRPLVKEYVRKKLKELN